MAYVKARGEESIESLLKRFKKKVDNEKIIKEYRDRQYFIKPSQKRHEHDRRIKRKLFIKNKYGTE